MRARDLDYSLPPERIAQTPAVPRDSCRLLVLDRATGNIQHCKFTDILSFFASDDVLVVNKTKVMPARLLGKRSGGGAAEILLLRPLVTGNPRSECWEALVHPGKRLKPGATVYFDGLRAHITGWAESPARGARTVEFVSVEGKTVSAALRAIGRLPLPPYINNYEGDDSYYQTIYAQSEESAAAPTAGLHFTDELMERMHAKGIQVAHVDLAVGLDTFRTIEEEHIEDHSIHSERYSVSAKTIEAIREAHARSGRVIAVGTTSVRCLESAWDDTRKILTPRNKELTSLYITPGYTFKTVDMLLTNFHVPRSSLLALVSSFASHEQIMHAYDQALSHGYRFLSFGDAMLII